MRSEILSVKNLENMWYMELGVKTEYVFWLPGGTQIVLEHEKKLPKDYDHQPADRGQRFNGFFF